MRRRRLFIGALAPLLAAVIVAMVLVASENSLALESVTPLSVLVFAAGGIITGILLLAIVWRVTVQKAREQGAREGQASQRQTHRQFLARLDHELKNPITAIKAALSSSECALDDPQLSNIESQANRLTRLVGDLRKLAELEQEPLEWEQVNLEEVAKDAVDAVNAELAALPGSEGRQFALDFPRVPWPLPPILGDVDLLFLAVYNLISNAAKYSPDAAHIVVRATEERATVVLEVSDTGMGIPEEDVATVWEELARGSNARGTVGSGLGLALVRSVVARHYGQAEIMSLPGEGTRVRIALPKEPPPDARATLTPHGR